MSPYKHATQSWYPALSLHLRVAMQLVKWFRANRTPQGELMELPPEEEGGSRKILHPITLLAPQLADTKGAKGKAAAPPPAPGKGKGIGLSSLRFLYDWVL